MDMIQDITVTQVISVIALIVIGIVAYKTLLTLTEIQLRKKYVLKQYLEGANQNRHTAEEFSFLERWASWERYRNYIEARLEDAKSSKTFEQLMMKRIMFSLVAAVYSYGIGVGFDIPIFMYVAIPVAILVFNIPLKQLEKVKAAYQRQLRIELPSYLSSLSILLENRTPQNAVKESIEYADETLRPYVEQLVTEMELYPADSRPFVNFAERVDVREAREFMVAFEQMIKVDSSRSKQIIDSQLEIMRNLQELTYQEVIEERQNTLGNYTMSMIAPFIIVTFVFIGVLMYTQFQSLMTL